MTYEEVAGAMGLSVGAVKAHFHQAVANLRRLMAARVPER
jgi:DNA-directed RNA polymerase specialized sigma24 family protein